MFVTISDIVVRKDQMVAIRNGDADAIKTLKQELDGMVLYEHALSLDRSEYEAVSLDDLSDLNIVMSITLHRNVE